MIRPSSLGLAVACPSSILPIEYPYRPNSEAADFGSEVHATIAKVIDGMSLEQASASSEVRALAQVALDAIAARPEWTNGRHWAEKQLTCSLLTGTIDFLSVSDAEIYVVDWKTTRDSSSVDYSWQMLAYAYLAACTFGLGESGTIHTSIVWLRTGCVTDCNFSIDDIASLTSRIARINNRAGKDWAPGPQCGFCPRQLVCGARHDFLRNAIAIIQEKSAQLENCNTDNEVGDRGIGELLPLVSAIEEASKQVRSAIRAAAALGPLLTKNDSKVVELRSVSRKSLEHRSAIPFLRERLGDKLGDYLQVSAKVLDELDDSDIQHLRQKGYLREYEIPTMRVVNPR